MLKRIAVSDLRVGMYLVEFCGSWTDHPFWKERFLLKKASDLRRIVESPISEVWIDTARGADVEGDVVARSVEETQASADAVLAAVAEPAVHKRVSFEEEARLAQLLCERSKTAVTQMFGQVRLGMAFDGQQVAELVDEIAHSILRHPHAFVSLVRLKTVDEYTYMHSVAVCGLMISLARHLELSEENVYQAGMAGLLHDIGKMAIPLEILNKPGKLNDHEFGVVRQHPERGEEILAASHQVSEAVIDVCLHHHEKVDGSGYPHHLAGDQISLLGRMAAVCDVYDAVTSDRPYKQGWGPADAIRKMAEWTGHFDTQVFQAFVKSIGIYPIGSLVRLESERLAVVIEQNESSLLTPKVKVFFSARSRLPLAQTVVDLGKKPQVDRIVGRESNDTWKFKDLNALWLHQ